MDKPKIGYAFTGSFCTFAESFEAMRGLAEEGCEITPIASFNAFGLSTRFGTAEENREKMRSISGREIISTIEGAEPIGPKKMFDVLVVAPCTANTLAKLAIGITDSPVCMAVKSHLRNQRPVVIAVSTNDGLSASAKNIGLLRNYKNYYFVPLAQDDYIKKPFSLVADFAKIPETIIAALDGKQLQPLLEVRN